MIRWLLLVIIFFMLACKNKPAVKDKIFLRETPGGNSYIYFNEEKYIQIFDSSGTLTHSEGRYFIEQQNISFTNFVFYDAQLKWIMNVDASSFLEARFQSSCFYFHPDVPDINWCEIRWEQIPGVIQKQLNFNR